MTEETILRKKKGAMLQAPFCCYTAGLAALAFGRCSLRVATGCADLQTRILCGALSHLLDGAPSHTHRARARLDQTQRVSSGSNAASPPLNHLVALIKTHEEDGGVTCLLFALQVRRRKTYRNAREKKKEAGVCMRASSRGFFEV